MCTAVTYQTKDFYFGRNLDYEFSFGEEVTLTPRNYPLSFRNGKTLESHFAIIGMAHVEEGYPLYYDAVNEKGLAMAGLNFVGFAKYRQPEEEKENIAVFELIPWILAQCSGVKEACQLLKNLNLTDTPFSPELPAAQLHWILADRTGVITLEAVNEGIRVYPNPVGVLTNNPPFDEQLFQLNNYMHLSPDTPQNQFSEKISLSAYSRGMGAMGLPGDLSSQSRFVRAAFVKLNSRSGDSEAESVSQFFHILGSVEQTRGCCHVGGGKYERTIYSACCNTDKGIYYYTTYENRQIMAVDMRRENLESSVLVRYPLVLRERIHRQN